MSVDRNFDVYDALTFNTVIIMSKEILTRRPLRLLYFLYERAKPITVYTTKVKQVELAKQLGISRQVLNVHLRKLRSRGYIRPGRGFIDITEEGLKVLGVSASPAFVFVRVSPIKKNEAYQEMAALTVQRAFKVAGDMDAVLIVDKDKLDDVLRKFASVEGIQSIKSYIASQILK
jgi:DNA-binding Lrp family transcriptional regulator